MAVAASSDTLLHMIKEMPLHSSKLALLGGSLQQDTKPEFSAPLYRLQSGSQKPSRLRLCAPGTGKELRAWHAKPRHDAPACTSIFPFVICFPLPIAPHSSATAAIAPGANLPTLRIPGPDCVRMEHKHAAKTRCRTIRCSL